MVNVFERLARMSFAFLVMNAAAVNGLLALGFGRRVWR